jgi:hypothetical protein
MTWRNNECIRRFVGELLGYIALKNGEECELIKLK